MSRLPKLKRIELMTYRITSVDFLLSSTARLESLLFQDVAFYDEWQTRRGGRGWMDFMEALSDPTDAWTHSLRELHVSFQRNFQTFGDPTSVTAMLMKNKRLLRCSFKQRLIGNPPPRWIREFLAHGNKPLPETRGPLPPAETLAFLSVVPADTSNSGRGNQEATATSPVKTQSAQHMLNTESLRIILDLAAPMPHRSCMVFQG